MKIMYFDGIKDIDALKLRYRELVKEFHPDSHPGIDESILAQVNAQYDEAVKYCTYKDDKHRAANTGKMAKAYRDVVMATVSLKGIKIELCGSWLWFSGNTLVYRKELLSAGCMWSAPKMMWYWRPDDAAYHGKHRAVDMMKIRIKYGSIKIDENTVSA